MTLRPHNLSAPKVVKAASSQGKTWKADHDHRDEQGAQLAFLQGGEFAETWKRTQLKQQRPLTPAKALRADDGISTHHPA